MEFTQKTDQVSLTEADREFANKLCQSFCDSFHSIPDSRLLLFISFDSNEVDYHVKAVTSLSGGRLVASKRGPDLTHLLKATLGNMQRKVESWMYLRGGGTVTEGLISVKSNPTGTSLRSDLSAILPKLRVHESSLLDALRGRLAKDHRATRLLSLEGACRLALHLIYLTAIEESALRPSDIESREWLFSIVDDVLEDVALRPKHLRNWVKRSPLAGMLEESLAA